MFRNQTRIRELTESNEKILVDLNAANETINDQRNKIDQLTLQLAQTEQTVNDSEERLETTEKELKNQVSFLSPFSPHTTFPFLSFFLPLFYFLSLAFSFLLSYSFCQFISFLFSFSLPPFPPITLPPPFYFLLLPLFFMSLPFLSPSPPFFLLSSSLLPFRFFVDPSSFSSYHFTSFLFLHPPLSLYLLSFLLPIFLLSLYLLPYLSLSPSFSS